MFYSPPTKTRRARKYWYFLHTPAGDCIVSATCASAHPARISRYATLLARAGSLVQIDPLGSKDAYRVIRSGVPSCAWVDKLRFVREVLKSYYTIEQIDDALKEGLTK